MGKPSGGEVYLKEKLYLISERARKDLGLSKSAFYRFCVMRTLQELGYLNAVMLEGDLGGEEE